MWEGGGTCINPSAITRACWRYRVSATNVILRSPMCSPSFRDAGRSRERQEATNRLVRLSRCPCPRVRPYMCVHACALVRASGTALSRIRERSNVCRERVLADTRTHAQARPRIRVRAGRPCIGSFRNRDIGPSQVNRGWFNWIKRLGHSVH